MSLQYFTTNKKYVLWSVYLTNALSIQLKLWPFCEIFAYFDLHFVAMATSLRPSLAVKNVFFGFLSYSRFKCVTCDLV